MRACWNRTLGLFDQYTRYRKPESLGDPQIPLYGDGLFRNGFEATGQQMPQWESR